MVRTRNQLKAFFETGDKPTQQQFADLLDSLLHKQDTLPSDVTVAANPGDLSTTGKTDHLYVIEEEADGNPGLRYWDGSQYVDIFEELRGGGGGGNAAGGAVAYDELTAGDLTAQIHRTGGAATALGTVGSGYSLSVASGAFLNSVTLVSTSGTVNGSGTLEINFIGHADNHPRSYVARVFYLDSGVEADLNDLSIIVSANTNGNNCTVSLSNMNQFPGGFKIELR